VITGAAACVHDGTVTFSLPDPDGRLSGVRLQQDVRVPGDQLDFRRRDGGWELEVKRPPVSRMEYLLELRDADGRRQAALDPGNPNQVAGAFGPKSVREFPGYAPPGWLCGPAGPGRTTDFDVRAPALGQAVAVRVWSPAGAGDHERLPLLVAHDGPEYDELSSLTRYLAAGVESGSLPALRAALLGPGPRDRWYSANTGYARALAGTILPDITARFATSVRIGMGTSLGALAMLHAYCRDQDQLDALFLQSGSFFVPALDGQERRFPYYRRITTFVSGVRSGRVPGRAVPVTLTCGTVEENLANNRELAASLTQHGYRATLHEVADAHNYTAWRDAFDPHLTELIGRAAG
jgi:enterochelin esterase family protein